MPKNFQEDFKSDIEESESDINDKNSSYNINKSYETTI